MEAAAIKKYAGHPIPFNGEMVRAILDGRKTQTRRVIKPQPFGDYATSDILGPETYSPVVIRGDEELDGDPIYGIYSHDGEWGVKCPWKPGDRLRVCETFRVCGPGSFGRVEVEYACDEDRQEFDVPDSYINMPSAKVRSSYLAGRFMPRWASRIKLTVISVRAERLQDINEEDAIAEGISEFQIGRGEIRELDPSNKVQAAALALGLLSYVENKSIERIKKGGSAAFAGVSAWLKGAGAHPKSLNYKQVFALLWDSLNDKEEFSWKANPLVLVTEWHR